MVAVLVGGRRLELPAARVREVASATTVTPVPTAPPPVVGLTQLRGHIMPVLDLIAVTDGEPRSPRPNDPLIIVELGPARVALLVDRVLGVQPHQDGIEPLDIGALFDQVTGLVRAVMQP